jgi:hypothetical protein
LRAFILSPGVSTEGQQASSQPAAPARLPGLRLFSGRLITVPFHRTNRDRKRLAINQINGRHQLDHKIGSWSCHSRHRKTRHVSGVRQLDHIDQGLVRRHDATDYQLYSLCDRLVLSLFDLGFCFVCLVNGIGMLGTLRGFITSHRRHPRPYVRTHVPLYSD